MYAVIKTGGKQQKVKPEEAERLYPRNVITRSLGPEPQVQVDIEGPFEVSPGDTFVLCSDGLVDEVRDEDITEILLAHPEDPDAAALALVDAANAATRPITARP